MKILNKNLKILLIFLAFLVIISIVLFYFLKPKEQEYYIEMNVDDQMRQELEAKIVKNFEILKEFPKSYNVYMDLGMIESNLGNLSKAIEYYKKAWGIIPANSSPWLNIGHIYLRLGMYQEAEKAFLKAKDISNNYYLVYYNLAELYKNHIPKNVNEVKSVYLEGLKNTNNNNQLLYSFSYYLAETGNYSEAIEYMKTFVDLTTESLDYQNAMEKIKEWQEMIK